VAKDIHSQISAHRAPENGNQKQRFFAYAAFFIDGTLFVDIIHNESDNAHYGDKKQIIKQHKIILAYFSQK